MTTIAQPLKGCPQALIAREFGVSQPLITADLKAIRKEWMKSGIRNFDEALNKELKKLDILEREAWAAWTLFMQPTATTRATQQHGKIKAEKTIRERTGDPRYLQIVMRVIEMRCKLLGLDEVASALSQRPDKQAIRNEIEHSVRMDMNRDFWGDLENSFAKKSGIIDDDYIERLVNNFSGSSDDTSSDLEVLEEGLGTAG